MKTFVYSIFALQIALLALQLYMWLAAEGGGSFAHVLVAVFLIALCSLPLLLIRGRKP